jgi:hypothetical protein
MVDPRFQNRLDARHHHATGIEDHGPPMENAMICHITEGELRIEQEGKTFTAKKDFVWTCNKDTKDQAFNDGRVVAIMRITDLNA